MTSSRSSFAAFELLSDDPRWPDGVRDLKSPPPRLHLRGEPPDWRRSVCIVGTRRADREGLRLAEELARDLGRAGCVIVSGGAVGIDAAAHRGARSVDASTVAVLASGLAPAYPACHSALFEDIVEHAGLLLSAEPPGTPVRKFLFLRRNQLVAALSRVVVVVQAPMRSGALSTARHAIRLGRPVLAVPAAPWDLRGAGGLALLRAGAGLCVDADDVLCLLEDAPDGAAPASAEVTPPQVKRPRKAARRETPGDRTRAVAADLDEDARRVLTALGATPTAPDSLARSLDLPSARVSRALFSLLLGGYVDERFGAYSLLRR